MNRKLILVAAALLLASTASTAQTQTRARAKANDAPVEVGPLKSEVYSPAAAREEQLKRGWIPANMKGYVKEPPPALVESPTLPCAPDYCPRTAVRVRADRN